MVSFEHGRVQIGHRGSRGAHDGNGTPAFDRETEGCEARDAFVNAHVEVEMTSARKSSGGESERL